MFQVLPCCVKVPATHIQIQVCLSNINLPSPTHEHIPLGVQRCCGRERCHDTGRFLVLRGQKCRRDSSEEEKKKKKKNDRHVLNIMQKSEPPYETTPTVAALIFSP